MGGTAQNIISTIKAPDEVLDQYRNVFSAANTAAAKPFQIYSQDPADFVAQINAQQQAGISGINAAAGSYQPFYNSAMKAAQAGTGYATPGELNIDQFMNPYQQDVINSTMALMGQANEQAQSGALGTATSSGAFGGDRAGIAAANLSQQQNLAMGSTLAQMNAANYNQALAAAQQQQGVQLAADQANLERQLAAASTMGNLGTGYQSAGLAGAEAQINAGTLQQQTEQAGLTALYNQFLQQQAYPFQTAQFLADITGAIGPNFGSTTEQREVTGSARGGRIGKADGGITSGMPYSSMFPPMQNAGAYVPPTGYVPVGGLAPAQMMVPDIVATEGPSTASDISSMADAFSTLQGMGSPAPVRAHGGRIYRADGGPAYLQATKPTGVVPPTAGYMAPVTAEAEKPKDTATMKVAPIQQNSSGGLGDILSLITTAAAFMNRGGRVGYADGGVPMWELNGRSGSPTLMDQATAPGLAAAEEEKRRQAAEWEKTVEQMRANAVPPDQLNIPSGLGMRQYEEPFSIPSSGLGAARQYGNRPEVPVGSMPEQSYAPETSLVPRGRPGDQAPESVPSGGVVPPHNPTHQPNRGIPLLTQAAYSLGEPEMRDYQSETYSSPQEAALAANAKYEKAGAGVGDQAAAQEAARIYTAIKAGGSDLLPNEKALYGYYRDNSGMDDMQIAGLLGRFNVEAGSGINPNARNDLAGGYGTYGIGQWRGPRFEGLAAAGKMTPEQLASMPVTNISGPAVADQPAALAGANMNAPEPEQDTSSSGLGAWLERNKSNPDFWLSILAGLGTAAVSPAKSKLGAFAQGLGSFANTYAGLQAQEAQIRESNARVADIAVGLPGKSIYQDPKSGLSFIPLVGGGSQSFLEFIQNPAGQALGGVEADRLLRGIGEAALARGVDINKMSPEEVSRLAASGATAPTPAVPPGSVAVPKPAEPRQYGNIQLDEAAVRRAQDQRQRFLSGQVSPEEMRAATDMKAAATMEASAANVNVPSMIELADVIAHSAESGDFGALADWNAKFDKALSAVNLSTGSTAVNDELLGKIAGISAGNMTPDGAAAVLFRDNAGLFPTLKKEPKTNIALTAQLMVSNMRDVERSNYYATYASQFGPGYDTIIGAPEEFDRQTGAKYQRETGDLNRLFLAAGGDSGQVDERGNPIPVPARVRSGITAFTEAARNGEIPSPQAAQDFLNKLFAQAGLEAPSPDLYRYFYRPRG